MSQPSSGNRPSGRSPGTNLLITAAALALTLSGWAGMARSEAEPTPPQAISLPTSTARPLPAVPTLIPEPDWTRADPAAQAAATAVLAPPPAAVVAPAAPAAPPPAVTVTRSSR